MNLFTLVLLTSYCFCLTVECAAQARTREEAAKLVHEYEESHQARAAQLENIRREWLTNPREVLYRMAHSDDFIFPATYKGLLNEAKPIFAPHAASLAEEEAEFLPLSRYAILGFDGKDVEFARKVIKKAILAVPKDYKFGPDGFDIVMLPLISKYGSVAQVEDVLFFREISNDDRYSDKVRNAARSVIQGIELNLPGVRDLESKAGVGKTGSRDASQAAAKPTSSQSTGWPWWAKGSLALIIGSLVWLVLKITSRQNQSRKGSGVDT